MAKSNEKKRPEKDRAPRYNDYLATFKANSPVLNRPGLQKSTHPDAFGLAMKLNSKQGKLAHLEQLVAEAEPTARGHIELRDAGEIQRAEHALNEAVKHLHAYNERRKVKGHEPITASELPDDRPGRTLGQAQARYDIALEEAAWLRRELKEIEENEQKEAQREKVEKKYAGQIQGFHEHDLQLPKKIDGRDVKRDENGEAVFADDGERVVDYMAEVQRRRDAIQEQKRKNRKILKQRTDLERKDIPKGVLQGTRDARDWLRERGEQVEA